MKKMQRIARSRQKGAVSLFIVIFTAMLVTTITVSFMQLMVRDQRQASNSDLSESAYDSAVAGVEDAKRALLMEQECVGNASQNCSDIRAAIRSGECTTLSSIAPILGGTSATDNETKIMQDDNDRQLEQAYTCVKITSQTADFLGSFDSANIVDLIPLRGSGGFDRVVISWSQSENGGPVDLPASGTTDLPSAGVASWPQNRPSLLRAQLINGSGQDSFMLSDLNNSTYSNTLFLYPSSIGRDEVPFRDDVRRGLLGNEPYPVICDANVASGAYACTVELITTDPIPAGRQMVFLALAAFYNPTEYRIQLKNGETVVPFDGVQPEVDSTGRANDLFRRVVSRVELGNTFTYPIAALETTNKLCKNFRVTTEPSGYLDNCTLD